ncbi:ribosomal protection-like ABC-F family protein [Paenibacillus durus]|uniref:ABC transporter ATP-binding protein n=1 Tax=Paenibacillus durus TaxID=44251 RepID=A0A089HL84_PAEDU|nr:ABC-F family ATP-binding cassette domain-containing protein [Paenibacillus durus]AIQ11857.1 ABC transporter ATP-binding protein [Paenibacillus durus]
MIIQCQNVQKYHGAQLVLSDVSFAVRQGENVGLIGRNGSGKTTLFRLLSGEEAPDSGQIAIRKGSAIGLLAQIQEGGEDTVYEVLQRSFDEPLAWQRRLRELEREMSDLGADSEARMSTLLREYGSLQEKFEAAGGYEIESDIQRVSSGLGISGEQFERAFFSLSGGEKTKVGLAALLLLRPDVLLLDEPTNHLDMAAIEWLEQFLRDYDGTVVVISHDRYFLDAVVTKIVEIEDGEAVTYHTGYTGYQAEKEARLLQQFADYQEQQKKIKKMQESIKRLIEWGNNANPPNPSFHRRAASMQKALDRMVKIKRPILERKAMDLQLEQQDRSGNRVLVLDSVGKRYGQRTLFTEAGGVLRYGETTALIGGNGAGKSTLLRIILGLEQPDEGSYALGSRTAVGYLAQEAVPEDAGQSVLKYFREQAGMEEGEARGQLARFLFYGSDVFKSVAGLSGGEWTRLRFAVLMHRRPNLLILDEPTNHLDIDSREALEEALEEFPGTVLAVSHDRYFINRCFRSIWALEDGSLSMFPGNYEYFKEKRGEQASARAAESAGSGAHTGPGKQTLASDTPSPEMKPRGAQSGSGPVRSRDARSAAAWESEIAEAEKLLHGIEARMLNPQLSSDADRLAELYAEREALQSKLDMLYAAWLDSSGQ